VSSSVERRHLGRGFEVSGEVASYEIAVPRQDAELFNGFLLGYPELRRTPGSKGVFAQTSA
jgi:hypothetical protein